MNHFRLSLLFLSAILVFSCKKDEPQPGTTNPPGGQDTTIVTPPDPDANYLTLKSDYIYDQSKLPTFELTLSQADLAKINADPTAEEYVEGSLTFEGETISPVGIRYKGSVGAFVGCVSGADWSNPSGRKTCTKLSMKVKFNWNDPEARFYGLKKLQFHAMNLDDSQMRDRLGYWLFRESGVPAPRSIHSRLMINGEYNGLFALVEQIDGRFTRWNYDDGTGNLYKEIWPLHSNGQPFSAQTYLNNLKTNTDENPTGDLMRTFAQEVVDANGTDELQDVIKKRMNLDEIITYAAVDRTIRVDDGAFHWYCGGGDCASHNFFWYENPTDETLHLIPWDMDNTFENIISNANPVTPIADGWGETRANCQPFRYGLFGLQQKSAACDKLTAGWASFEDEYEQALIDFKTGPLAQDRVEALLDNWSMQIREATMEATEKHGDAVSISEWESKVNQLKNQLNWAREN